MSEQKAIDAKKMKQSATFAGSTFLVSLPFDLFGHFGPTGLLVGGLASYVAWKHGPEIYEYIHEQVRGFIPPSHDDETAEEQPQHKISWWDRAWGLHHAEDEQGEQPGGESAVDDPLFTVELNNDTNGIARLTIEQIVRNCQPNSYKIFIGRSMKKDGNKAVLINFYKQHFRFIGASQRGKSSMVAAFLDIVTQTHDPKHVRLVLLDKEDQTSWLFAHLPHVLSMKKQDGRVVKMHARNEDQVLEYLIQCVALMNQRIALPKMNVLELPIILVYIEEFLSVKNEFRSRIDRATEKDEKEKATSDYATFMYCIGLLAQQGLKARVQLLLCAQVEYADDDFREAMASIGCGFSFCVRPKAAASAGFMNTELLNQNAKDNKIGQAVVETPDCNDLVLAPDYDLEKRLLEFEKAHPEINQTAGDDINTGFLGVNDSTVNHVEPLEKTVNVSGTPDGEKIIPQPFTQAQEVQVILAYHELEASGEKVTRTALRDYLKWNSKQYQFVLKPICDKHNILMD